MIAPTLAIRNLWKNRRRSLATLLAIAIGFASVNLFSGYIHNVYEGLRAGADDFFPKMRGWQPLLAQVNAILGNG